MGTCFSKKTKPLSYPQPKTGENNDGENNDPKDSYPSNPTPYKKKPNKGEEFDNDKEPNKSNSNINLNNTFIEGGKQLSCDIEQDDDYNNTIKGGKKKLNPISVEKGITICLKHNICEDYYCIKCTGGTIKCLNCMSEHNPEHNKLNKLPSILFQKYQIFNFLGKGGFASVFKAKKLSNESDFLALKVINIQKLIHNTDISKEEFIKVIKEEADIHKKLKHCNIINFYDSALMGNNDFFIIELELADKSLKDFIKLPEERAQLLFLQIVKAIQYLHKNTIIHRDLKPGNILIKFENGEEIPKIADFGGAKLQSLYRTSTKNSLFGGTIAYLPPEKLINPNLEFNEKFDIWALGIIYHKLLTGQHPLNKTSDIISISNEIEERNQRIIAGKNVLY